MWTQNQHMMQNTTMFINFKFICFTISLTNKFILCNNIINNESITNHNVPITHPMMPSTWCKQILTPYEKNTLCHLARHKFGDLWSNASWLPYEFGSASTWQLAFVTIYIQCSWSCHLMVWLLTRCWLGWAACCKAGFISVAVLNHDNKAVTRMKLFSYLHVALGRPLHGLSLTSFISLKQL